MDCIDYLTHYILLYFSTTNQVVLVNGMLSSLSSSYTSVVIDVATSSAIHLIKGAIFASYGKFYIGGNDPLDLFATSISAINFKTAFIYSFQQSESSLTLQAHTIL